MTSKYAEARERERQQEVERNRVRQECGTTRVLLHKYPRPNWLRKRLINKFGAWKYWNAHPSCFDTSMRGMHEWLEKMFDGHCGRLDHWGVTTLENGCQAFVTEPYQRIEALAQAMEFVARQLGCDWLVSENSWWNPGATIRGALYEGPDSIPVDQITRVTFDPILHQFNGGEHET